MKLGTQVEYRDRSNRKRIGKIDRHKNGNPDGKRLYRVDGKHWFMAGDLKVVQPDAGA